jgi:aspartyl-tRNA(Asn)/glutamyl-tRNA(Gln) amidotransferase subunit C
MLTKETVEHVAKLARLRLTDSELTAFAQQLSAVLVNFDKISQVDTANVRPLVTPTDMTSALRPDETEKLVDGDSLLANAAEKSGRLFRVPPVV